MCGFIGSAGDVNAAALCSMQLCASSRRRCQDGRDKRRRRGETTQCAKQLRRGHPRLLGRGLQAIRELQTQARRMRHVRRHLSTASAADGSIPQLCDAACNASHPVNLCHHAFRADSEWGTSTPRAGPGGALHGMEVPSSHAAQQGTLGVECEEALKSALRQPQVELVLSRLRATHQLSIEATRCVRSVFMPRTLPAMYESQHALRSPPQVRSNYSSARVL